ncbi:hypothetical protein [Flavobacterium notoginsengisoli]|uniref:hypothetical protein n=1 Tax=Flavobacterium notoginsengisoli TaxID=1478199 RepID=UPI003626EE0D
MKKILTLFAVVGMMAFSSCSNNDDDIDYDTISEVFEREVDFNPNGYSVTIPLTPPIFESDVVLVYHLYTVSGGNDVWRLIPQTYYMDDGGALDFNYDFTINRINIFLGADFPLGNLSSDWTQNQVFRIVIVPGGFSNTGKSVVKEDYSNYHAVIKKYNINDSNVKRVKL